VYKCYEATGDWVICIMKSYMIWIDYRILLYDEVKRNVVRLERGKFVSGERKYRNLCRELR
jgi:hypothetical protein